MQVVLGLGLLLRECGRVVDYEEDHAGSDTPDYLQISQANLIFFVAVERAVCPVKQQVIGLIELAQKAQLEDENEEHQEDQQREDEEDDEDDDWVVDCLISCCGFTFCLCLNSVFILLCVLIPGVLCSMISSINHHPCMNDEMI